MKTKYIIILFFLMSMFTFSRFCDDGEVKSVLNEQSVNQTILIIDAGHGGLDGGAVGFSGVTEQAITLNISKKADFLCGFLGIASTLTRDDESSLDFNPLSNIKENKIADTRARTKFVNSVKNSILVSVHLNSYTDEKSQGAQIFYNDFEESQKLANILQTEIREKLDVQNKREALIAPTSVYLIQNANCPAIIYECGFLSNQEEEQKLQNEDYQTKLAICLVSSYMKIKKELNYETKGSISLL